MIDWNSLRKWQKEAYEKWVENNLKGLCVATTGTGKSVFGLFCIQKCRVSTIIIVPTTVIMNQWKSEVLKHLDVSEDNVGLYYGDEKNLRPITIAIINSVRKKDLSMFRMCVMDEVHKFASEENIKPIKGASPEFEYTLGLTATLKRKDERHKLIKKSIGEVFYNYDVEMAKKDGVVSNYIIKNISVPLTVKERGDYDSAHEYIIDNYQKFGSFEAIKNNCGKYWTEEGRIASTLMRSMSKRRKTFCNAEYKKDVTLELVKKHSEEQIIVFCEFVDFANELNTHIQSAGYKSGIFHSKKKDMNTIKKFSEGELDVLVSVKSLNEGLDVKGASVGIIVAGNKEPRDLKQRLGRILRSDEGKEKAILYQLYAENTKEYEDARRRTFFLQNSADLVNWDNFEEYCHFT